MVRKFLVDRVPSSSFPCWMWHHVVWWISTNISEETDGSAFRVEVMEAAVFSKTLVPIYWSIRHHIPEVRKLNAHPNWNLVPHTSYTSVSCTGIRHVWNIGTAKSVGVRHDSLWFTCAVQFLGVCHAPSHETHSGARFTNTLGLEVSSDLMLTVSQLMSA